jgi:hypothetical protein
MNDISNLNVKNTDQPNSKSNNLTNIQLNEAKKTRHKNKQVIFL